MNCCPHFTATGASQGLREEASKMTLFQMRTLRLREAQFAQGHRVRTLKSRLPVPAPCLDRGVRTVPQRGLWTPSGVSPSPVLPSQHPSVWPALTPIALGTTRAVREDTFCLLCKPGLVLSPCSLLSLGGKGCLLCYGGK